MPAEERTVVKTTVPRYQKDVWTEHADDLGMSRAEFVRSMVQAGRRGFQLEGPERPPADATPGVDGLESRVLEVLASDGPATFDEIVDAVSEDLESRVDETLRRLDEEGRVDFSNLDGYVLAGGGDGVA